MISKLTYHRFYLYEHHSCNFMMIEKLWLSCYISSTVKGLDCDLESGNLVTTLLMHSNVASKQ